MNNISRDGDLDFISFINNRNDIKFEFQNFGPNLRPVGAELISIQKIEKAKVEPAQKQGILNTADSINYGTCTALICKNVLL